MNMKSNPIIIMKHDQAKKRSGPVDLKRKIGSLPAELPMEKLHVRGEVKPRSTSKSEEKGAQLGLSKGFLISKRVPNRSTSGERIKSSSSKKGKIETVAK